MHSLSLLADLTIPFQFGLLQFIILIIGLSGLALLAFVVLGLTRGKKDNEGNRLRHFRWGHAISGTVLMFIAIALLYLALLLQVYLGLTGNILVAHVRAQALTLPNAVPYLIVDLTLFDQNGHQLSENKYGVCGNEWLLEGDILRFPAWLNILGVHSGYKVTRLEGRYDDLTMERTWYHSAFDLNGGDDGFFKSAYHGGVLSWLAQAQYGSGTFVGAGAFNVDASQDALIADPDPADTGSLPSGPVLGSSANDCRQLT